MTYEMKDLGYKRTPTSAAYRVAMNDGSQWEVPVQVIADSRDANYAEDQEDTVGSIKNGGLSNYEIPDWAGNNMNWSDVAAFAVKVSDPEVKIDYEDGWANGGGHVVGAL